MKNLCMKISLFVDAKFLYNLTAFVLFFFFLSLSLFIRNCSLNDWWRCYQRFFALFFFIFSYLFAFVLFAMYTIRNNIGMSSVFSRYHHHFKWTVAKWTEFRVAKRIEIDYGAFPFGLFLWISSFDFTLNVHIDSILPLPLFFSFFFSFFPSTYMHNMHCIYCIVYFSRNWELNRKIYNRNVHM